MIPSELIEQYGWIQGEEGNLEQGFSLTGALRYCAPNRETFLTLQAVARYWLWGLQANAWPWRFNLESWNDDPNRSKADVLELLRRSLL